MDIYDRIMSDDVEIYVWERGDWISWDDDANYTLYNPGYLSVTVPSYVKDYDAFAKKFAEDNKGNFPSNYYDDEDEDY